MASPYRCRMTKAYFLRGDSYLRYDVETDAIDGGYPKPIAVGWTGLADAGFGHDIDTVLDVGDGKACLFKDDAFVRVDQTTNRVDGEVQPIADVWTGLADAGFTGSFDASVNWGNGKAYFFRGDQYIRYDLASAQADEGYPLPIADNWPGLGDAGFADGLDAAVNWGNGSVYFFRGDQYLRYDVGTDAADAGYPLPVAEAWPGFDEAGFGVRLDAAWLRITPAEGLGQATASGPLGPGADGS